MKPYDMIKLSERNRHTINRVSKSYSYDGRKHFMKIALGSDEHTHLTDILIEELKKRGHELTLFGPIAEHDPEVDWPQTSSHVAQSVASGSVEQGIVCCWT